MSETGTAEGQRVRRDGWPPVTGSVRERVLGSARVRVPVSCACVSSVSRPSGRRVLAVWRYLISARKVGVHLRIPERSPAQTPSFYSCTSGCPGVTCSEWRSYGWVLDALGRNTPQHMPVSIWAVSLPPGLISLARMEMRDGGRAGASASVRSLDSQLALLEEDWAAGPVLIILRSTDASRIRMYLIIIKVDARRVAGNSVSAAWDE